MQSREVGAWNLGGAVCRVPTAFGFFFVGAVAEMLTFLLLPPQVKSHNVFGPPSQGLRLVQEGAAWRQPRCLSLRGCESRIGDAQQEKAACFVCVCAFCCVCVCFVC